MSRRRPSLPVLTALGLLSLAPLARAQDGPPPNVAPPAAPPTLAQALTQGDTPRDTVWLAVGADKTTLPKGAAPPPPGAGIPQTADAYGRITQAWETAGAVAPPTMAVLNTAPGTPHPYDGLPPQDALKLLLGGLDDGQWATLTGDGGLGYGDLTADDQRGLFRALFPGGTLTVRPLNDYTQADQISLTPDDCQQARLRLRQQVSLSLQDANVPNAHYEGDANPDGGPTYSASSRLGGAGDSVYGVKIRDVLPNALKPTDLDAEGLTMPVPVAGVKTVGQLVSRIGTAAHRELYADPRYAGRPVTLIGPPSARAGDLLRALALCVCGTYRKVGPAYVLTDDLTGLGTRQAILNRFAQAAQVARAARVADAGDRMLARGGVLGLPPTAPGLGLSSAEQQALEKDNPFWDGTSQGFSFGNNGLMAFGQLTPAQQDLARRQRQQASTQATLTEGGQGDSLAHSRVLVQPKPVLQLLSPAVPRPVALGFQADLDPDRLFQPSGALRQKLDADRDARLQKYVKLQAAPAQSAPPPPSLASVVAPLPRRALYARPRTAGDVDALLVSMHKIGLDQLWLDVFSQGQSHLTGERDILTEALAKAKAVGIAVVPVLDLLDWGADAPEGAADRTILSETAAQAADYQQRYALVTSQGKTLAEAEALPPVTDVNVSPAAPEVVDTLTALVRRLAATPGVAALALQDTVTSGYDHAPSDNSIGGGDGELGFTLPLRLACLRRTGLDPVDVTVGMQQEVYARASLPEFTEDGWQAAQEAGKQWNGLRAEADVSLLRRLLAAAQAGAGRRLPLFVRQRGQSWNSDWWGLWDDPRAPLPAQNMQSDFDSVVLAHTQCRLALYALPGWASHSPGMAAFRLRSLKPGWDGVVLDASDANFAEAGDPLAALARMP